jgi:hypothetical protein
MIMGSSVNGSHLSRGVIFNVDAMTGKGKDFSFARKSISRDLKRP